MCEFGEHCFLLSLFVVYEYPIRGLHAYYATRLGLLGLVFCFVVVCRAHPLNCSKYVIYRVARIRLEYDTATEPLGTVFLTA